MERDDAALDGLLRALARTPERDDAFVRRVLSKTQPVRRAPRLAAAALLLAALLPWQERSVRVGFRDVEELVGAPLQGAVALRVLSLDGERWTSLGELPFGRQARVPASALLRFQAIDAGGRALWTGERVRRPEPRGAAVPMLPRDADYVRDVKPILEQHCAGCHSELALARSIRPFDARRSGLATQTHAPISDVERQQLALWIDLGAAGRP